MQKNIIIQPRNKKDLQNLPKGKIIAIGGNEKINRMIIESKNIDILLDPEPIKGEDFMKSRNSGLNQVLCRLAAKNKVAIGFNINRLINLDTKERIILLGRIIQNIKLYRKYKLKVYIINIVNKWYEERDTKDLKSFSTILGIPPGKVNILKIKND